jgi:hypothetical protein
VIRLRRHRRHDPLAAALGALLGLFAPSGCSLLVTTDDLSGGGMEPRRPTDAGAVADAELPSEEGNPPVDPDEEPPAPAPAPPAPNVGASRCAALDPQPTFCADFDTKELEQEWAWVVRTRGTLMRDQSTAVSAPWALLSSFTGEAGGAGVSVGRGFPEFAAKPFSASFAFDAMVSAPLADDAEAVIGEFQVAAGPRVYSMEFQLRSRPLGGLTMLLDEHIPTGSGFSTRSRQLSTNLASMTWFRVRVDVNVPSLDRVGQIVVLVNDAVALTGSFGPTGAGEPRLYVGLPFAGGALARAWTARHDNVVVQLGGARAVP